jgi:hypothetical protein
VKTEEDEGKEQVEMLNEMFNLPRDGLIRHANAVRSTMRDEAKQSNLYL